MVTPLKLHESWCALTQNNTLSRQTEVIQLSYQIQRLLDICHICNRTVLEPFSPVEPEWAPTPGAIPCTSHAHVKVGRTLVTEAAIAVVLQEEQLRQYKDELRSIVFGKMATSQGGDTLLGMQETSRCLFY
jgi:hypothetical protein